MGCAACGQKRIGFSAATAHVLGSDTKTNPIYVLVKHSNVLPNVRIGEYRWVTGSGVAGAVDEGLISESGVSSRPAHIKPSEVWCVTVSGSERCFRTLDLARRYARKTNSPIEHKLLKVEN